jgi:hypothetical protein
MCRVAAFFLVFTAVGCASAEATMSSDDAVMAASHSSQVHACDATHEREAGAAGSTLAMIRAEAQWQDCLASANHAAIAKIEANLRNAGSGLAGTATSTIEGARKLGETLCEEEDKADANFGGTLARVEAAGCRASREHFLAQLMDAFVDFGGNSVEIPEARTEHVGCYVTYDAAMKQAGSTAEMLQALFGLTDCVGNDAANFAEPIAAIEMQNDPSVGDLPTSTARVKSVLHDVMSPDGGLCMLLNEAGENGTGSLSRVSAASCQARIAEAVYADLKGVAGR